MQRTITVLGFAALAATSLAGGSVTINMSGIGEVQVFEAPVWPTKPPKETIKLSGDKVIYKINTSRAQDRIFLINPKLGLVASKLVSEVQEGTWELKNPDFAVVYKTFVAVSTPKGPISAASVDLQDGLGKRTVLLDPSMKGTAEFYFVKPGDVQVVVNYNDGGKMADPVRQSFKLTPDPSVIEPTFKVALPAGEAVAGSAEITNATKPDSAPTGGAKPDVTAENSAPPVGTPSPVGNLLTTLIGLAVVGGIAYFVYKFVIKNPDKVTETLAKLGADIPKPGNPDPDPVAAPITPIAPAPMQPIILDDAPVDPAPAFAPIQQIPSVVTGIPKLVDADGSAFDLPDGETVVGREFGNGLVVPNDTVSRRHASLVKNGPAIEVTDHGSTNGTWVNGSKLSGSRTLQPGDSVRFGSVEYRYEG